MSYNPSGQGPYYQPYGQAYPPSASPDGKQKKKWTKMDWFLKFWVPVLGLAVAVIALLYAAGVFKPGSTETIPSLSPSYTGSMTRDNDGATFGLSLSNVSENSNGAFTASATIFGCPAEVSGSVKASGVISFKAIESRICQDQGLVGNFSGNVQPDGSLSGRWSADTSSGQIVGSWSLQ